MLKVTGVLKRIWTAISMPPVFFFVFWAVVIIIALYAAYQYVIYDNTDIEDYIKRIVNKAESVVHKIILYKK